MWAAAVLMRYWGMQLPGTLLLLLVAMLLAEDLGWPQWGVWAAAAVWVVKDALLYLVVWPAYDPGYISPFPYRMEGAIGAAVHRIEETGMVRVWGELWHAQLSPNARCIEQGEKVRVQARHGMTLVVVPCDEGRDGD